MNYFILTIFIFFFLNVSYAVNKAAFGTDDRQDIFLTSKNIKRYSSGVANWQSPVFMNKTEKGFQLDFPKIGEEWELCKWEKFWNQPTAIISCTGFLVAPDLLMTAGHCMVNVGEIRNEVTPQCSDFNWMFDFKYDKHPKQKILKNKDPNSIVSCKKVIYAIYEHEGKRRDFALVQLNRKLTSRYFFPIDNKEVKVGDKLALLGHPAGLPMKFSGPGRVLRTREGAEFYEASIDSYGGNSGSPVFDIDGKLRGILVRGLTDLVEDKANRCVRWNKCSPEGRECLADDPDDKLFDWNSGMHIQRITPEIINLIQTSISTN